MAIMAAATVATVVARPLSLTLVSRRRSRWGFSPLAYSSSSSSSSSSTRKLVLYSKPGCCLCDGLKEKLQAAFLLSGPDSLHDVDLQEALPRLSPRIGVELIQKKIAAALRQ
ncbi:glutaredoxin-like protein [Citrus sinensis]|uniref:Glutaredoxin-like protein n=1 Tax=Citrus sinensis TaxID=2711 RepID=A0ACB8KRH8_CITSI|nr:glutaredoxin-like protein [Citrus sinensis]KAH9756931.1 glutaredoxin-like protein [Citrus sinensis]